MLSNFFLLDLNKSLESYIFDLIQSIKINKFDLLINDMTIVLVNHDKRSNSEKNFSFKSMITQFDDKKRKFENNCNGCPFNNTRYIQRPNSNHYY